MTSNLEDPIVVYSNPGSYDVTLKITDSFGTNTQTIPNFIIYTDTVFPITNSNSLHERFDSDIFLHQIGRILPLLFTIYNCRYWINATGYSYLCKSLLD